ncbi:MAG: excinuclease ABC subunit UvrA [Candidatus Moranbacteria bacterium]|nr:excinuclease ABC subunit UvrA [Candidatus Moranbacteria bacterium]
MAKKSSSQRDKILVRGARVNNLKNIDVDIPRDKLVIITGLSGSGKSSLAFDTIFTEGNRRYMEGISSYARNFLDASVKPDVDKIENLSPTIAIDQRSISRSPRSTVGTLTEIYDYLRILFAKIGKPHCPECGTLMQKKSNQEILDEILPLPHRSHIMILAKPLDKNKNSKEILRGIQQAGYARVRFNKKVMGAPEALLIASDKIPADIEIVVDRIILDRKNPDRERIVDSIETAMKLGKGSTLVVIDNSKEKTYNQDFLCRQCGTALRELTPRHFSFNNPEGACLQCSGLGFVLKINPDLIIPNKNLSLSEGAIQPWSKAGGKMNSQTNHLSVLKSLAKIYGFSVNVPVKKLSSKHLDIILFGDKDELIAERREYDLGGVSSVLIPFEGVIPGLERKYQETKSDFLKAEMEKYMVSQQCPICEGKRLRKVYLSVLIDERSIDEVVNLDMVRLKRFLANSNQWKAENRERKIAKPLVREMIRRLESLENVGLEYLNLARSAQTISGGEAQRIRLAAQINSRLMGITYILDEPSIGLHNRDTDKLVATMKSLRDAGNSLLIVEHDENIIRAADWIIDMGPGAGENGGTVVFEGTLDKLLQSKTLTAAYLVGRKKVCEKEDYRKGSKKTLEVIKASEHNLKNIDVKIPLEKFVVICGVSGSGKSTLVQDILAKALARYFYKAKDEPGKHKDVQGISAIDKVISVDQSPIGRTPRSNAATYTGVFSQIRDLFAGTEEARSRGYAASRFSFNMKGGRCEVCQGEGMNKIEMYLLPDMYIKCEACDGTRYSKKTLDVEFRGFNIAEVLDMDVSFALNFFSDYPLIAEKLEIMEKVGLGYLKLGQSATNLSGGEAQRIKLAAELARKSTGKTLYILDEPTVGLHFDDTKRLLSVLDALVERGNTVLVVEHNLDVVRNADWVIELGPDGGEKGGEIVYEGTPDKLKKCKKSWTAKYL